MTTEKIVVDFRGLDEVQRATALRTDETMRQSQVKNLLLSGLILRVLIHIPKHSALTFGFFTQYDCNSHFTKFIEITAYAYWGQKQRKNQMSDSQRPHLSPRPYSSVPLFSLQPTRLQYHRTLHKLN